MAKPREKPVYLAAHRRAVESAMDALREQTARRVIQMVCRLSRKCPGQTIEVCSGMGSFAFWIDGDYVDDDDTRVNPIACMIRSLAGLYGWGWVVPQGDAEVLDGKVISSDLG